MLVWVNWEEHEHSGGAHMIKPTERGVKESLLAHCLWKMFTNFYFKPYFSQVISQDRNIAFF